MASSNTIELHFLGRDYEFNCPDHQREALTLAAAKLDQRMLKIQSNTNASREAIMLMAALNLSFELETVNRTPAPSHLATIAEPTSPQINLSDSNRESLVELAERLHALSSLIGDIDPEHV